MPDQSNRAEVADGEERTDAISCCSTPLVPTDPPRVPGQVVECPVHHRRTYIVGVGVHTTWAKPVPRFAPDA